MPDTIAARVARGAALLDEHEPGWWQRIDLGRLSLSSACNCILGQLWSDENPEIPYEIALDDLDLYGKDEDLGFDRSCGPGRVDEYDQMDAAWRELIKARRAGGSA